MVWQVSEDVCYSGPPHCKRKLRDEYILDCYSRKILEFISSMMTSTCSGIVEL